MSAAPSVSAPLNRSLPVFAFIAIGAVILLHAGLVAALRWNTDDFFNAAMFDRFGLTFAFARIAHWSPRPFSETLVYLHWALTRAAGGPATAPILLLLWTGLAASLWAGFGADRRAALPAAALYAAFLLGHPIAELFYWPMGAMAYLPTLSGIALATLPASLNRRRLRLAGLLLAAGSAEIGAMAALAISAAYVIADAARPGAHRLRRAALWVPALLAGAAVLAALRSGRVTADLDPVTPGLAWHHAGASLLIALRQVLPALAPRSVIPGLSLLIALQFWRLPSAPARDRIAAAAGLVGTAFLSCAAADYQFGGLACCERHETFREILGLLLIPLAARPPARARPAVAACSFALSMALWLPERAAALIAAWQTLPAARAAAFENWRAGAAPGPAMIFDNPPADPLTGGSQLPPGPATDGPAAPFPSRAVLQFFGKHSMSVRTLP